MEEKNAYTLFLRSNVLISDEIHYTLGGYCLKYVCITYIYCSQWNTLLTSLLRDSTSNIIKDLFPSDF